MKIINVVSGKGGTGKTLVVAVLAELLSKRTNARVLVIDTDIFVRGLTTLLFYELRGTMSIVSNEELMTVSDALTVNSPKQGVMAKERCREFDVWPAVSAVDKLLKPSDLGHTSSEIVKVRVDALIDKIPKNAYDFVFLDSRAGFDELVAETYKVSDVVLNVADSDRVSALTSGNLVKQLHPVVPTKSKRIYSILNKSLDENQAVMIAGDIFLGRIPFDADIMRSYGSGHFWSTITRSLIEPALVDAWNELGRTENWREDEKFALKSKRQSVFPSAAVDRRLGQLTSVQRFVAVYGVLFLIGGGLVSLGGRELLDLIWNQPLRLSGAAFAGFGAVLLLATFSRFVRGTPAADGKTRSDPSDSADKSEKNEM